MIDATRWALPALLLVAALRPAAAQQPLNPDLLDRNEPLVLIAPPEALTRADLARRLKKLDKSLPDVLPAGAAIVVGPGRMVVGRTTFEMHYPWTVEVAHGTPAAYFSERESRALVEIEFDAAANARYSVDFVVQGTRQPDPGGTFRIEARALGVARPLSTARVSAVADGHQLFEFQAPRSQRVAVRLTRESPGPSGWRLVRVELLRIG
jgi:hypothetical protein